MQLYEIDAWLKNNLDEERYLHSLGTSEAAVELAERFGEDTEKAKIAGLVHDCAKCLPTDKLMQILKENNIVEGNIFGNYKTLHAPAGAIVAAKELNIDDEQILSAISCHTIGKLGMSNFEKIIFIADKIESKTRPSEYINYIRPYLDKDNGLDRALLQCFKATIKSLADRELVICQTSIDIYNELVKEYGKN